MPGLVHVYTGNGKGKTTAAVGLGVRACGRGRRVLMVQFLKGRQSGEMNTLQGLGESFEVYRHKEIRKFTWNMTAEEREEMKREVEGLFQYAVKTAKSGQKDMLILDEIMASITSGFIALEEVLGFIESKPAELEVVMTGRNAPPELIAVAHYVSEIQAVKHPLQTGIPAREGIEF